MPTLTARLLRQFPYRQHASSATLQRGQAYYEGGRVGEIELLDASTAICQVQGNSADYEVEISAAAVPWGLDFDCECPFAADGNFCKHMYAAALELIDQLEDKRGEPGSRGQALDLPQPKAGRAWQQRLSRALTSATYGASPSRAARYAALLVLERVDYYSYGYGYGYGYDYGSGSSRETYTLAPYSIAANAWAPLAGGEPSINAGEIAALLEADTKWVRAARALSQTASAAGCLNLEPEAIALLKVLLMVNSTYYGQGLSAQPMLLSLLARSNVPLFLGNVRGGRIERRLHWQPTPVGVTLDLRLGPAGVSLVPGIEHGEAFEPITTPVKVISRQPAWALLGSNVAQLRDPQALELLAAFPVQIPAAEVEAFREQYFPALAQRLPIRSGIVQWHEVRAEPVPRLYLRDDKASGLAAEVRFAYGEHEVTAAKTAPLATVTAIPDTWELVRIHRQGEQEAERLQKLGSTAYGLKRGDTRQPYGTLVLRARVHPFDFLLHQVPQLAADGVEVYGEERLKVGKVNRSTPTLRVAISSGVDWFDLKAVVEFGEQQISLHEVRKALQKGERFVKLADGSAGQIPEAWLEQYRHLWKLATETPDGFRVRDVHLPLVEPLLEADPTIKVPPDLEKRRNRLRAFERITRQPAARGFRGELRPYQEHGVDWLWFLHEYGFGGLLADDMGLGKTIQVLALLQLLKERTPRQGAAASLLVAPKSLMANWQREAEKFAPGLRLLLYVGQGRSKDTTLFAGQDVVLTTYGTLLRDIDRLRRYRFRYAILDESQAIKNPLAKSAKAARLVEAEHRLALTGTPVENNTLELWSQLAFLNPGLLGSLEFFQHEFAGPIERQGDEAAAALLRRLVYPFILRRTKAQVAPELPPRAERVIYADMAPAQAKLYSRTRDRYRAELLGLIDTKGMNDARFKILEGLLRLRQIAIHPGLVERSYRGQAPKLELLLETLETLLAEGHKALIFSQFVGVLQHVKRELDARRIKYVYLDGRTGDRQARVDQFQRDAAYPFFLISLKAGGVGLNLTAAEYVIHLDPWWNPAVEMQASDRVHRIGQDKPVFIYKLITRDTVEEKILELQEKKRALVNSLVTTEASFFKSLTKDEVSVLFGGQ